MLKRLLLSFALLVAPAVAFAQAPPPVPVIPDANRYVSYSPVTSTSVFNVTFPVFGSCEDLTVQLNGTPLTYSSQWTCASASGTPLASLPLPITDMQVTLATPISTGFLEIIGNWQPRRTSQPTNPAINRYEVNESLSAIIAGMRELHQNELPQPPQAAGDIPLSPGSGGQAVWTPFATAMGTYEPNLTGDVACSAGSCAFTPGGLSVGSGFLTAAHNPTNGAGGVFVPSASGYGTSVVEVDPSGNPTPGYPYSIDVTRAPYGAKCDGTTDDGAAIGAAIQALAAHIGTTGAGGKLVGCAGKNVLVATSINATGLNTGGYDSPITIDMGGMFIHCETGSYVCFDMTEDNYVRVNDLNIYGNSGANESKIGLQLVDPTDAGTSSAHENSFTNLSVTGYFTQSSVYLESAEVNIFQACYLNDYDSSATATLVLDGFNHFNAASHYYNITRTQNTAKTFSGNIFTCGGIQEVGTAPAIWIGGAYQFRFKDYLSTTGSIAVDLYQVTNGIENSDLEFDTHIEAYPGLLYDFLITGPATAPTIPQLTYTNGVEEALDYVFKLDTTVTGTAYLYNLKLNIPNYNNGGHGIPTVFDQPSKYAVTGYVYLENSSLWVAPNSFNGVLNDPGSSFTAAQGTFGNLIVNNGSGAIDVDNSNVGAGNQASINFSDNGVAKYQCGNTGASEQFFCYDASTSQQFMNVGTGANGNTVWGETGKQTTLQGTVVATGLPTSCTSKPTGTFWNNSGVLNVCP